LTSLACARPLCSELAELNSLASAGAAGVPSRPSWPAGCCSAACILAPAKPSAAEPLLSYPRPGSRSANRSRTPARPPAASPAQLPAAESLLSHPRSG